MDLGRNILRKTPKVCFSRFEYKPALLNFELHNHSLQILQVILAKDDLKLIIGYCSVQLNVGRA